MIRRALATLLLLPGVLLRLGLRELFARLTRTKVAHYGFLEHVGGKTLCAPGSSPAGAALVVFGSAFGVGVIGSLFMVQLLVNAATVGGFLPVPAGAGPDDVAVSAFESMLRLSGVEAVCVWVAVSCWWITVLSQDDVIVGLAGLLGDRDLRIRPSAVVAFVLSPLERVGRVTDRLTTMRGLLGVVLWYAMTAPIVRAVVSAKLGT